MGTNFYTTKGVHIGKRSAAGMYCWHCRTTLCEQGEEGVHYGAPFAEACPKCGRRATEESLEHSTAGLELGFNRDTGHKVGVASCSSFYWAMRPARAKRLQGVVDEYGRYYTAAEFDWVLMGCPIQYMDGIGTEFS